MTNSPFVVLRDTISKQTDEYTPEQAQQWLEHPIFGLRLEVANTNKPEVLSAPFIFDADGNKHIIEDFAEVEEEVADEEDLVVDYNTLTKEELITLAAERNEFGTEIDLKGNKADLVAALEAYDAETVAAILDATKDAN